jgi:ribonuclease P protein component
MVDHAKSEGARYERAAFRNRLRRQIRKALMTDEREVLQTELDWVLSRQTRYDARPGGLGR